MSPISSHAAFSKTEGPWGLYQVEGVLDFGLVGILNSLTKPLADAGVSVFAISTYNTDYLLVKDEVAKSAELAWRNSGFEVC